MDLERKQVSKEQLEFLVRNLEEDGSIKCNTLSSFSRKDRTIKWKKLSEELNKRPGANKTPQKWLKCWSDKKNDVRKKARRISQADGNQTSVEVLTNLEERILKLSGIAVFGEPIAKDSVAEESVVQCDIMNTDQVINCMPCVPVTQDLCESSNKRKHRKTMPVTQSTIENLMSQISQQNSFLERMTVAAETRANEMVLQTTLLQSINKNLRTLISKPKGGSKNGEVVSELLQNNNPESNGM